MTDEQEKTSSSLDGSEVPHEEWPSWCEQATADHHGREVRLRQADQALGEVSLAAGQKLVAIVHDALGSTEALTIKCGSSAIPVSYVVAQPQAIRQQRNHSGELESFSIIDSTGRTTFVGFA
jgi:hypothetical protein